MELAPEVTNDPHQEREDNAHDNACHDGKVEAAVASLHHDVSGKAAQPKRQFETKHKGCTHADDDNSNDEQKLSELAG